MNLWDRGGGDRDPNGHRTVTIRQLIVRAVFYVIVFAGIIWWAKG